MCSTVYMFVDIILPYLVLDYNTVFDVNQMLCLFIKNKTSGFLVHSPIFGQVIGN